MYLHMCAFTSKCLHAEGLLNFQIQHYCKNLLLNSLKAKQ